MRAYINVKNKIIIIENLTYSNQTSKIWEFQLNFKLFSDKPNYRQKF